MLFYSLLGMICSHVFAVLKGDSSQLLGSLEIVHSNCTIALRDLVVWFPNLLEPWIENMYARLKDLWVSVRNNVLLVLSHLILNDMMKVEVTKFISFNFCRDFETDEIIS